MYSFYKPGIKKNSILVHEHDLWNCQWFEYFDMYDIHKNL